MGIKTWEETLFTSKPAHITLFTDMVLEPHWALNYHVGSFHELLHIIKGELHLTLENEKVFHAKPGETLIIKKGLRHRDCFDFLQNLEVFIVLFEWDWLDKYMEAISLDNINQVDLSAKTELKRLFDTMRFDFGNTPLDLEIANSRLMTALLLIYRSVLIGPKPIPLNKTTLGKRNHQQLVVQAKRYIDTHFHKPLQLIDIAEELKVSPFFLSRVFSMESDFSLIGYLTYVRIHAAQELIKEGRYIIADIAQMVGYQESNYFSKVFKREIGCSPSDYK